MSGFLLDTNICSELSRPRPEPRVVHWLEAADDSELFLSVINSTKGSSFRRTVSAGSFWKAGCGLSFYPGVMDAFCPLPWSLLNAGEHWKEPAS